MSRAVTRKMAYLPSESQLQDSIVDGLEMRGYTVMETGRWRYQVCCPCGCGHWFTPHTGMPNTTGCPDLYITRAGWGYGRWIGMELKAPGAVTLHGTIPPGRLKKAQKDLKALGVIVVVHSWEEAEAAIREVTV